jgi:mannose/fructose/N-acetylgalactosamine-specific phosphotransferase system component IIB
MSQEKTKTIKLTEEELDNFRAIAEKYRVPFEVKQVGNYYRVTAPEDKIIQWGYDE